MIPYEPEPRKRCEVCGIPSRDSICDVCYPLMRAREERGNVPQELDETIELDRVALIQRTADAKN